jgi:DNA/RNA endonuclease YhcR with UshA esterase domain
MNKILIASLIISLLGISIMFYVAKTSAPSYVPLNEIDSTYIGKTISTTGKIVSINYNKGNIFLTLYDKNSSINVPIFSNVAKYLDINLKKGQKISVSGIVDEYKGKLQIIPRKATDIKVIE